MARADDVARTAALLLDPGQAAYSGTIDGVVFPGRPSVFYLAVCADCGGTVQPFSDVTKRNLWVAEHDVEHTVRIGVEVRSHQTMTGEDAPGPG